VSIKINIPPFLQPFTNNTEVAEVNGSTIGECLNHLVKQFPSVREWLLSKNSELFEDFIISVNREVTYPQQLASSVTDGDELHIIFLDAGG
jgi:molybdopterin converting factor small subunit